jgi:hypothetical protein
LEDTTASAGELQYYQSYQFFRFGESTPLQTIADSGLSIHKYELVDLNRDGYRDLKIEGDWYNLLCPSYVWLFDPDSSRFEYCEVLSGTDQLEVDENGVYSTWAQSTGGRGGYGEKFILEKGRKRVIESEDQNFFDYEKKALVNGQLVVVAQGIMDGALIDQTIKVTSKQFLFDSLRIVSERVLHPTEESSELAGLDPAALISEPFGQFVLRSETTFSYEPKSDGKLQVRKTVRRLVGKKLVTVSSKAIRAVQ